MIYPIINLKVYSLDIFMVMNVDKDVYSFFLHSFFSSLLNIAKSAIETPS